MRKAVKVAAGGLFAAAAIVFAPLAHADDAAFIGTLERDGLSCNQGLIKCANPDELVATAKALCYSVDKKGESVSDFINGRLGSVSRRRWPRLGGW